MLTLGFSQAKAKGNEEERREQKRVRAQKREKGLRDKRTNDKLIVMAPMMNI
jgi:hypothetical protein